MPPAPLSGVSRTIVRLVGGSATTLQPDGTSSQSLRATVFAGSLPRWALITWTVLAPIRPTRSTPVSDPLTGWNRRSYSAPQVSPLNCMQTLLP